MLTRLHFGAIVASAALFAAGSAPLKAQTVDTTLKVGVIPISDVAPLYLGIAKGYFKDEHLTIEPVPAQGGAAIIPAVLAGDEQIGFSNVVSMILASSHGLPLQAVINGSQIISDGNHTSADVLVSGSSAIKTMRDLEGKTVAVNTLNNIGDITIKDVLERHGVDISKVKFIELGFPEMPVALKQNRVDAIWAVEPFLTAAKRGGARVLFSNYDEYDPQLTVAAYFTTHQYATQHADVLARFTNAMAKSLNYAIAHPNEARAMLSTYTKLDAPTAASMALAGWSTQIKMASIEHLQTSMVKYGMMPRPIDLKPLFPPSSLAAH